MVILYSLKIGDSFVWMPQIPYPEKMHKRVLSDYSFGGIILKFWFPQSSVVIATILVFQHWTSGYWKDNFSSSFFLSISLLKTNKINRTWPFLTMPGSTIWVTKSNWNRRLMVTENLHGKAWFEWDWRCSPGPCPILHTNGGGTCWRWISFSPGWPHTVPWHAERALPVRAWLASTSWCVKRRPLLLNSP